MFFFFLYCWRPLFANRPLIDVIITAVIIRMATSHVSKIASHILGKRDVPFAQTASSAFLFIDRGIAQQILSAPIDIATLLEGGTWCASYSQCKQECLKITENLDLKFPCLGRVTGASLLKFDEFQPTTSRVCLQSNVVNTSYTMWLVPATLLPSILNIGNLLQKSKINEI